MAAPKRSKITEVHREEAARLKAIWDSRPHRTQAEFGEAYDLGNQANVGHYLHARSALNPKAAAAFAKELQCSIDEFSPRVAAELGQMSRVFFDDPIGPYRVRPDGRKVYRAEGADEESFRQAELGSTEHGNNHVSEQAHSMSHPLTSIENTIRVPVLAIKASMGSGLAMQGEEEMVRSLSLSPQWISSTLRPSRAESLRFIHGHGDSMAPTFNSGDVLLVDTDIAEATVPGVYVLEAQDQLFVKRVNRRLDGVFEISSDNPAHRTVEVLNGDHEVAVKGRVIWVWNGRKL